MLLVFLNPRQNAASALRRLAVMAALSIIVAVPAPARSQTPPALDARSAACGAEVARDPAAGAAYAAKWSAEGGGLPARHCTATALLAMGEATSAAVLLADIAEAERARPGVAARLKLQSAEAFMAAGRRGDAYAMLRDVYALVPDAPEVHMIAATIYATGEEWEGVVLSLNALERHTDLSADAYVLRGRANLQLGRMSGAALDTVRALSLDARLVDALVLRGELRAAGISLPHDPFAE